MDLQKMPRVGDLAPDFELPDDAGKMLRLSDLCRERVVLLLFYPADFGMICSIQMGELRDINEEFLAAGVMVLPLGTNSIRSHAAWKEAMRLPFPLLADEDARVTREWNMACDDDDLLRNRACRGAFIIDRKRIVRYRWIPPTPHQGPDVPSLLRESTAIAKR
ncbi:MAG: putative peroxiredoxin [Methanomassiliicoccales archaeon PtaB.Bin215]|nr:MAG: putative peroxiredoxin [Methanomassiliicoccales archaeon PtaB.Bin215]